MRTIATSRFVDPSEADRATWRNEFETASPFPHLVIDDFIPNAVELEEAFPAADWDGWSRVGEAYQAGKRHCADIDLIPDPLREMIIGLNSPRTLRTLECVTGIRQLLADPYLEGAGLHMSIPGGVLMPHSDFHHHPHGIYRRLNLLLYLNDGWTEADGGTLELYPDRDARETPKRVVPVAGRCVLFATDDRSVHGFTQPIAEGRRRKSIALYYYTAAETPGYSGDGNTVWRHHGEHTGVDKARVGLYRMLLKGSRGMSKLAHLADPNRDAAHKND